MNMKLEKFIYFGAVALFLVLILALQLQSDEIAELKRGKTQLQKSLSEQIAINSTQQSRIKTLHELDTKHTQELSRAKTEIDWLHADAVAHPERVYIKAKCPVPKIVTSARVDDAATARPTDTAVRNYWLLRERIVESEQMIAGLQDYIQTQCVGEP